MVHYSFDFFISYRRAAAGKIIRDIKSTLIDPYDYKVFLDLDDLKHSNDWKKSVDDNLAKSRVILVVLAKGSFLSEHTNTDSDEFLYEIGRAKDLDKPLITIDYDGFFSACETQRISNKEIAKWLNQPTAIPFNTSEHENRKNLISGVIERMKGFDSSIDSFGGYLPESYMEDQIHILRSRAKRFFDNDSRIDRTESYQLFNFAKDRHIDPSLVDKIIDEFESASIPNAAITHAVVTDFPESNVDQHLTDEQQRQNIPSQPIQTSNTHEQLQIQSAPDNSKIDFNNERSDDYENYEYFNLGSLTVTEVLNSPEQNELIELIDFYATDNKDATKSVLEKLKNTDPSSIISIAIEGYVQFLDPDRVGHISVAVARDLSLERVIARLINQPDLAMIQDILSETHGRTKVCRAFAEHWPDSNTSHLDEEDNYPPLDYHSLASMKSGEVLSHEWSSDLIEFIAEYSNKSKQTVKKYLNAADSDQLVIDAVKGYRDFAYLSNLAGYNVKYAKDYDLARVIDEALRLDNLAIVESVLSSTNGHTLLKKAFSDYWPK